MVTHIGSAYSILVEGDSDKLEKHLGKFNANDKAGMRLEDKIMAWVMVEFDILEGLLKSYLINWGDFSLEQCLDYRGIPFWCLFCHNAEHVKREFPSLLKNLNSSKY